MSQYPKLTMTDSAIEMIAESQLSGTDLEITKVKIGDGLLPDDTDIKAMTDVVAARMEAPMTSSKNDGKGQLTINFAVGNENLDTGFFAREIGIFAKLTGGEEKLYAYTNAGNKCDWIPDKGTPIDSQVVTATLVIGNAASVTVNIKDNAYALAIELVEHKEDANAHATMLDKHNSDDHAHPNRLRPPLQRSTTYAKGDIAFHDSLPSWAYLECTQAGTTSNSEPAFGGGRATDTVTDGTAKFIVRDMRCKYRTGEIVALYGEQRAWDYLLLCDGSTVSADNYPELCEALGGNVLPNLIDRVLQGGSVSGQYKGAGLPNVYGAMDTPYATLALAHFDDSKCGALRMLNKNLGTEAGGSGHQASRGIIVDASLSNAIYGNSSTVQPPAMTIKYYICYA